MEESTNYEFYKGFECISKFEGTATEARRKGDELANIHGRVQMRAFNSFLCRWEWLTTFLGNRNVIDSFGHEGIIDTDYRNIWQKEGGNQ